MWDCLSVKDGINYRAEVWVNGNLLSTMNGMFIQDYIEEKLGLILKAKEIEHGCKCELIYKRGYPVVVNDKKATDFIKGVAISSFEEEVVDDSCEISTIAEDFSYYLKKYKGSFIWFGVDGNYQPLHSDTFDIDEENIWMGSYLFAKVAEKYLK